MPKYKEYFVQYLPLFSVALLIKGLLALHTTNLLLASFYFFIAGFWFYISKKIENSLHKDKETETYKKLVASNDYENKGGKIDDADYYSDVLGHTEAEGWTLLALYIVWLSKNNLYVHGEAAPKSSVDDFLYKNGELFEVAGLGDFKLFTQEMTKIGGDFSIDYYLMDNDVSFLEDLANHFLSHGISGKSFTEFTQENDLTEDLTLLALPPTLETYSVIEPILDRRFKEWSSTYAG